MKAWKVKRTRDGRHKGYILYGGHWIQVGWWWYRSDAVRFLKEAA